MSRRPDPDRVVCPVPGCTNTHRRGLLMCFRHWKRVPAGLQAALYRAYDKMLSGIEGSAERYADVRARAIAAAASAQPTTQPLELRDG